MRVVHVFVAVTLGLGLAAVPAAAQQQRHGTWQDEAERVQELIDEIRPLIERSRRARAADPRFLEDLEAILGRYDSPWRVPLLADDFGDGDYTRNPAWTVHSGEFSIHPRRGLLSRVDPTVASRRYSRDAPAADDIATPAQAISSGDLHRGGDKRFAFDDDLRTSWASYFDGPGNEYRAFIGQDFGAARHIRSIYLTQRQDSTNGNANRIDVQRWAYGRWETVRSFSIAPDHNRQLLRLPPSAASARWRLLATSTNVIARGAYWYVAEIEFMQAPVIAGPASGDGGQAHRPSIEDIGARILQQILQGRRPATQFHGGSSATPPPAARQPAGTQVAQGRYRPYRQFRADAAEISTRLEITNAFSIRLRLTSLGNAGRLLFGPYQGGNRRAGYRLAYNPGGKPSLELLRVGHRGRRPRVIETYDDPVALRDGRPHLLEWTRTRDGTMTVSIDSRELMRVQDRRFRDPFDGFTLINRGGDYAVRWIRIKGTR